MKRDFTDFVRAVDTASDGPSEEAFTAVWVALRRALSSELRKRGLWNAPPSYLGVFGFTSWSDDGPVASTGPGRSNALEELTTECYSYVFIDRLQSLRAQIKAKPSIEGLVFLSIRNFLFDRQRQNDPIGFRVFEVLRAAIRLAILNGDLVVKSGAEQINNSTLLGIGGSARRTAGHPDFAAHATEWAPQLLPEIFTARGARRQQLVCTLADLLGSLSQSSVTEFSFRELADSLKAAVRVAWADQFNQVLGTTAHEYDAEDVVQLVRTVIPDETFENQELFERLCVEVPRRIRRLQVEDKTGSYLEKLWAYYSGAAQNPDLEGERQLSRRELSRHLGIPRDRLPSLVCTLGTVLQECRAQIGRGHVN